MAIIVKRGSSIAKIYATPSGGYQAYTVAVYIDGRLRRFQRATMEDAQALAKEKLDLINSGNIAQLQLSAADVDQARRALTIILPTGKTLETVCTEYVAAWRAAGDRSMIECITYANNKQPSALPSKLIADTIAEYLAIKTQDGFSEYHLKDLSTRLNRFQTKFIGQLSAIRGADIDAWLRSIATIGPRSRNNYRLVLSGFFKFCISRGYLPKDWCELDAVPIAKARIGKILIWTPDELAKLLTSAPNSSIELYLLLGCFAGVRTAEILRMKFEHIRFDSKYITVNAESAKLDERRLVPIQPNLMEWLLPYRAKTGPLITEHTDVNALSSALGRYCVKLAMKWKHNAGRHSYASYRLAQTQDAGKVVEESGNSIRKLRSNYRELVLPSEATRWFNITPAASVAQVVTNLSQKESNA